MDTVSFAPVAPSGWPKATAPPFTLTRSAGRGHWRGEPLRRGVAARTFVGLEIEFGHLALTVAVQVDLADGNRHTFLFEATGVERGNGFLMARVGKGVGVLARDAKFVGEVLSR